MGGFCPIKDIESVNLSPLVRTDGSNGIFGYVSFTVEMTNEAHYPYHFEFTQINNKRGILYEDFQPVRRVESGHELHRISDQQRNVRARN